MGRTVRRRPGNRVGVSVAAVIVLSLLLNVCLVGTGSARADVGQRRLVYFAFPRGNTTWLLPVGVVVPDDIDLVVVRRTLEILCQGPPAGTAVDAVVPRGTVVRNLDVRETVTVNFNSALATISGGARAEQLAVQAIVHTLCQFPTVKRVQIKVEGKTRSTLAGHVDISRPLSPDPGVLFSGFPDVAGNENEGAVLALTMRGILGGYPDGTFRPERPVTKAEAVKSLLQTTSPTGAGLPPGLHMLVAEQENGYADVPSREWYAPYVYQAVRAGVLERPQAGERFDPDGKLTAGAMALWLVRAGGWEKELQEPDKYGQLSDREKRALALLVSRGVMPSGLFDNPGDTVGRGRWARVLAGFLGMREPELYVSSPGPQASLEGQVLVMGMVRGPAGGIRIELADSRARLAGRVTGPVMAEEKWASFAEWLAFRGPLTPSAGVIEVARLPREGEKDLPLVIRIPVLVR